MKLRALALCAAVSMVAGTAIFGFVSEGFYGLLAVPFLLVFGWFYVPVVVVLHLAAFWGWRLFVDVPGGRWWFILTGMRAGAGLFSQIGIKEQGSEWRYACAYASASSLAALISCSWISAKKPAKSV